MILYHGTNIDFEKIELAKCRPNKDFGQGFYLTDLYSQAKQMSVRRCEFEGIGTPVVQTYEFDESILNTTELNIKIFEGVSAEWAEFILLNRKARGQKMHEYDIVVGPVADDGVVFQLNLYMQHLISIEMLVKELTYKQLNNQYFFGTEKALIKLTKL